MSFLIRATSLSGKSGFRATSATKAIAFGPNSESTSVEMSLSSAPTFTSTEPPMSALSSATCFEVRVFVPSFIKCPIKSARPGNSAGSFKLPALTTALTVTFGKLPYGTSVTFIPFGSEYVSCAGTVKGFGALPCGGACFCALAQTLIVNIVPTASKVFALIMFFIVVSFTGSPQGPQPLPQASVPGSESCDSPAADIPSPFSGSTLVSPFQIALPERSRAPDHRRTAQSSPANPPTRIRKTCQCCRTNLTAVSPARDRALPYLPAWSAGVQSLRRPLAQSLPASSSGRIASPPSTASAPYN